MALRSPILIALLCVAPGAQARFQTAPDPIPAQEQAPDPSGLHEHAEAAAPSLALPFESSREREHSESGARRSEPLTPPAAFPPTSAALESRPLGPAARPAAESVRPSATSAGGWLRVTVALGAVIALIYALRFVLKRAAMRTGGLAAQLGAGGRAPSGVLEVLGRFPVARGQTLVLLRMDRRILLISQTAGGMSTLAEITDPEEIASLITRTRDDEGASAAARFNAILRGLESDPDTALALAPAPLREPERVVGAADPDDPVAAIRRRLVGLKGASA